MDSTHHPSPEPSLKPASSSFSSASKLPVKRKTPSLPPLSPNPPSPRSITTVDFSSKPHPPFKFHRIWTEPDEIRFLQGLLDSASDGLSFPRDLHVFFDKFSNTTSHPFSKSQLSEKLRRLRKKFRVLSSRISRGVNPSLLSPHDRVLFDLSKQLWSPEFASVSPFGSGNNNIKAVNPSNSNYNYNNYDSNLVGVRVSFSPVLPLPVHNVSDFGMLDLNDFGDGDDDDDDDDGNADAKNTGGDCVVVKAGEEDCGSVVARSVLNVFDGCLKEVQVFIDREKLRLSADIEGFEKRWRQQRVAEIEVFARRLRLVLENSVNKHSIA